MINRPTGGQPDHKIDAATKMPQLKVSPNMTCGNPKNRLASGYNRIRGVADRPTSQLCGGNCTKRPRPVSVSRARKNTAPKILIWPEARGRERVRAIFLSIFLSHRSLTTQPAARITIAPTKNSAIKNAATLIFGL